MPRTAPPDQDLPCLPCLDAPNPDRTCHAEQCRDWPDPACLALDCPARTPEPSVAMTSQACLDSPCVAQRCIRPALHCLPCRSAQRPTRPRLALPALPESRRVHPITLHAHDIGLPVRLKKGTDLFHGRLDATPSRRECSTWNIKVP